MNEQINLGPFTFHNYEEAFTLAHDTLAKYKKGETVTDQERNFLIAVLKLRGPEGLDKISCGIKRIYVDENKFGSLCFHMERVDGSVDDFSYKKCFQGKVDALKKRQKPAEKPPQTDEKLVKNEKPADNKPAQQTNDFFSQIVGKKITLRLIGGGQPVTGTLEKYSDQGLIVRCAGKGQILILRHNITVIEKAEPREDDWW
jgi:hypothetical protein